MDILANKPRRVKNRRKQVASGKRGPKIRLGLIATHLYNYQKLDISYPYARKTLAEKLKTTDDKIDTAIDQLKHFGYIKTHLARLRKKKDGTPSKHQRGHHIEKIYGGADQIKIKDLNEGLYADADERRKIKKRKQDFSIDNLILDDSEASIAVKLCKSVGVKTIDLFWNGKGLKGTRRQPDRDLARSLKTADTKQRNLIGRCDGKTEGTLIQLDEVPESLLPTLAEFSFMQFETSPDNFQSWLALPINTPVKMRNRIRDRLIRKLKTLDPKQAINGGSWGSMRWVGSKNQKHGLGWIVRLQHKAFGKIVTSPELENAGLLAPPEKIRTYQAPIIKAPIKIAASRITDKTVQQDYRRFLKKHPERHDAVMALCVKYRRAGYTPDQIEGMTSAIDKVIEQGNSWIKGVIKNADKFIKQEDGKWK